MASYKELKGYIKAFNLAMRIFQITKTFPADERYGLISQIRRSSRAVFSNLAERYRKRRYPAHVISKLTDAGMENSETLVWIDFSLNCRYISQTLNKSQTANCRL
jgi:four helix bundle protein